MLALHHFLERAATISTCAAKTSRTGDVARAPRRGRRALWNVDAVPVTAGNCGTSWYAGHGGTDHLVGPSGVGLGLRCWLAPAGRVSANHRCKNEIWHPWKATGAPRCARLRTEAKTPPLNIGDRQISAALVHWRQAPERASRCGSRTSRRDCCWLPSSARSSAVRGRGSWHRSGPAPCRRRFACHI